MRRLSWASSTDPSEGGPLGVLTTTKLDVIQSLCVSNKSRDERLIRRQQSQRIPRALPRSASRGCGPQLFSEFVADVQDVHVHAERVRPIEAGIREMLQAKPSIAMFNWSNRDPYCRHDLRRTSEVLHAESVS